MKQTIHWIHIQTNSTMNQCHSIVCCCDSTFSFSKKNHAVLAATTDSPLFSADTAGLSSIFNKSLSVYFLGTVCSRRLSVASLINELHTRTCCKIIEQTWFSHASKSWLRAITYFDRCEITANE